ncbi:type IV toxin-antitoxin system AbiEi family antitoxin domain-containing protein [Sporosarcina sp. CAU 1771]
MAKYIKGMIGMFMYDRLDKVFRRQNGYATTNDLVESGITPYYINKFVKEDYIERVKKGLYRHSDSKLLPEEQIIEVSRLIPHGVICLLSAAAYHELSTINPWEYHIAIERSQKKPPLPSYPPIQVYYFNKIAFENNIEEKNVDGYLTKIYNIEKTVCDLIRYEDTIGRDIMLECIKTYMKLPTRNLNKLIKIATEQKVDKKLVNFIEVLL